MLFDITRENSFIVLEVTMDVIDNYIDPSGLAPSTLYVYNDNIYLTDETVLLNLFERLTIKSQVKK